MKMIVVNISNTVSNDLSEILINANYRVTHLSVTGSLFRGGATTLMIGVEDELVQDALQVIRDNINNHPNYVENIATIYVLNANNFYRLEK